MANVVPGYGARDLGNGLAATFYQDGTVDIWNITTGQKVTTVRPGDASYDLGTGQAATMGPGGQFSVYDIGGQANPYGYSGLNLAAPIGAGGTTGGTAGGAPTTLTGTRPAGYSPMTPSGYTGFTNWGMNALNIRPEYIPYLNNPAVAPGYLPSSGTYNQYPLNQPGLFGMVAGVPSNLRYGLGGTGDPTTGREVQTPEQIVNGPKLFNSTRTSNWGQGDQAGTGLDYIATLF